MGVPRTLTNAARLVTTVTVAVLVVCACGDSKGNSVTEVRFTAPGGATTSIADFRGMPLVVNLWATNCVPCVKEMPALDEVATELAGQLRVIGVNVFDTPQDAAAFATDLGVGYPQFTDPDGTLSTALSVTGLPATAFFDSDGKLINVHQGAYTADEFRSAIAQHLPAGPQGTEP